MPESQVAVNMAVILTGTGVVIVVVENIALRENITKNIVKLDENKV